MSKSKCPHCGKVHKDHPLCAGGSRKPAGSSYPAWTASYSNEDFDRIGAYAQRLTDEDRVAGRLAPAYGYGKAQYEKAERAVKNAQRR